MTDPTRLVPPERHFSVTVRLNGEDVVTIETAHLAGRDIGPDEEWAIRTAASHLLAFIGDPAAITSDENDDALIEAGTQAVAKLNRCVSDDQTGNIELCKGPLLEHCSCRNDTRAVIVALKEMKR